MRTALIPPIPDLAYFGQGDMHLILSHLLKDATYRKHYTEQRKRGAYLILDNSAHEYKAGEDHEVLLKNAVKIQAQEVVVPDVLFNADATVSRAVQTLECWCEGSQQALFAELMPILMYVPQGNTESEWAECLQELVRLHTFVSKKGRYERYTMVVGLSKDYEDWDGGLLHLVDDYLQPARFNLQKIGIKMHVHMLGWGRNLWALRAIAKKHPWIRSTDSAKPFVYALNNIELNPALDPPPYPKRARHYFKQQHSDFQIAYAFANVAAFKAAAVGKV